MIEFRNEASVGPEICRLLYLIVPEWCHAPIHFHNHRKSWPRHNMNGQGMLDLATGIVHINLHDVWWDGRGRSTQVWRKLLSTSLHEYGHVATDTYTDQVTEARYWDDWQAHEYVESYADRWANDRLRLLLKDDPRLGQPLRLSGHLGARAARLMQRCKGSKGGVCLAHYLQEQRLRKTGAQLTAREAALYAGISLSAASLRRLCPDVGQEYVDTFGRRHRFYVWGDIPILRKWLVLARSGYTWDGPVKSAWWYEEGDGGGV